MLVGWKGGAGMWAHRLFYGGEGFKSSIQRSGWNLSVFYAVACWGGEAAQ